MYSFGFFIWDKVEGDIGCMCFLLPCNFREDKLLYAHLQKIMHILNEPTASMIIEERKDLFLAQSGSNLHKSDKILCDSPNL